MKLNVKVDGQAYLVEIGDLNQRPIRVQVEGETFEIWPEEAGQPVPVSAPIAPSPAVATPPAPGILQAQPVAGVSKASAVQAPIPGVIISITVKEGDSVAFGQELCVLEAMKMKNLIRANRAGIIAAVRVSVGDQVRHSQILMEYAD